MMTEEEYLRELASYRVTKSSLLSQYLGLLVYYDWPNYCEHLQWVYTAPTDEILDWIETVEAED